MGGMALSELVTALRDSLTVGRVFGEPYERDGVTVIPAASVRGAAGGGAGKRAPSHEGRGETSVGGTSSGEEGEGGGLGFIARPAGAYVIKDGEVTWHPAVDVNRIVTLGILGWVAVAWVLARSLRRRG
jgi:uncharacterized spore protein YtfJ